MPPSRMQHEDAVSCSAGSLGLVVLVDPPPRRHFRLLKATGLGVTEFDFYLRIFL
jgi:hypothetical protein